MTKTITCSLCNSQAKLFYEKRGRSYYECSNCFSINLDPSNYVTNEEEKSRYMTHNNDIHDLGYQNFVAPIVVGVKESYNVSHMGLDYGAGTGPVITSILEKEGYNIKLYDPYFHPYPENLKEKYDFIICSEVIEHFHNPYDEFKSLFNMLNKKGTLFCMTSIYEKRIDFHSWNYKNDETHVFFYHKKALDWIKNEFKFLELEIDNNLIKFIK